MRLLFAGDYDNSVRRNLCFVVGSVPELTIPSRRVGEARQFKDDSMKTTAVITVNHESALYPAQSWASGTVHSAILSALVYAERLSVDKITLILDVRNQASMRAVLSAAGRFQHDLSITPDFAALRETDTEAERFVFLDGCAIYPHENIPANTEFVTVRQLGERRAASYMRWGATYIAQTSVLPSAFAVTTPWVFNRSTTDEFDPDKIDSIARTKSIGRLNRDAAGWSDFSKPGEFAEHWSANYAG